MMCARANDRVIDADGGTLAGKQVIQHWAAEMEAEIGGGAPADAPLRLNDRPVRSERGQRRDLRRQVRRGQHQYLQAVDRAIQVHGALGVTDDTVLAYWYRHERAAPSTTAPPRSTRPPSDAASSGATQPRPQRAEKRAPSPTLSGSPRRKT